MGQKSATKASSLPEGLLQILTDTKHSHFAVVTVDNEALLPHLEKRMMPIGEMRLIQITTKEVRSEVVDMKIGKCTKTKDGDPDGAKRHKASCEIITWEQATIDTKAVLLFSGNRNRVREIGKKLNLSAQITTVLEGKEHLLQMVLDEKESSETKESAPFD